MARLSLKSILLWAGAILVLLFSSVVGINQYYFGMWNHYASLPWLYDRLQPELYPHDLLVEQASQSPSLFLPFIESILPFFNGDVATCFFTVYLIAHLLMFWAFYHLALSLFKVQKAGIMAVVVLSAAFPVIGDVQVWDSLLMERTLAYPLLIASLSFLLRQRYWPALLLQALAFNFHPPSAFYVIFAAWVAVWSTRGWQWRYLLYAFAMLLFISPVLYLKWKHGAEGEGPWWQTSDIWLKVMRLRNAHHAFPSAYPPFIFIKSGLLTAAYFIMLWKAELPKAIKRFAISFGLSLCFLMLLGTVFTEWFPIKLVIQLQFFRAFLFLATFAFIFWAGFLVKHAKPIHFLLSLVFLLQFVYDAPAKTLGALFLISGSWFIIRWYTSWQKALIGVTALLLLTGILAWQKRPALKIDEGHQSKDWYAVQEWAQAYSAPDALFIVPPQEPGFRVKSRRSSYGDWYDGTKAFFSKAYAQAWYGHMKSLNCLAPDRLKIDYLTNDPVVFEKIAEAEATNHSEVYLIQYRDRSLSFPRIYENNRFRVYRLH